MTFSDSPNIVPIEIRPLIDGFHRDFGHGSRVKLRGIEHKFASLILSGIGRGARRFVNVSSKLRGTGCDEEMVR